MRITHRVATSSPSGPGVMRQVGMQRTPACRASVALVATMIGIFAGCSTDEGVLAPNELPETEITSSVPANDETVAHHVEVMFSGRDNDGSVSRFEYLVHTYPRSVSRYADIVVTLPDADDPRWAPTGNSESPFAVDLKLLADTLRADPQGDIGDGRFDRWYTIFVRAIDNEDGIDPTPDPRTFKAYTRAPSVWLLSPALASPRVVDLPRTFALRWNGVDEIGDAGDGRTQNPEAVRWVLVALTAAEPADPAERQHHRSREHPDGEGCGGGQPAGAGQLSADGPRAVQHQGERCAFLRCNNEHQSLGIFPKSWRKKLGLSQTTSNLSFGLQLAYYRQLKDAVKFLRDNGVRVETDTIPPELHPGIDYAAYAFDPDGHCIELYCSMEQLGWEGKPRPKELRRKVDPNHWPEILEPLSDTYTGEPYIGPWA